MWVTADGRIRHELLPDGRYEEARDARAHAYRVIGNHIDYVDDRAFPEKPATGNHGYRPLQPGDFPSPLPRCGSSGGSTYDGE